MLLEGVEEFLARVKVTVGLSLRRFWWEMSLTRYISFVAFQYKPKAVSKALQAVSGRERYGREVSIRAEIGSESTVTLSLRAFDTVMDWIPTVRLSGFELSSSKLLISIESELGLPEVDRNESYPPSVRLPRT